MTSTLPPLVQAFSGAIGSASANILTYPLDLVTTRVQLDPPVDRKSRKPRGILRAILIIRHIIRRNGLSALYDGIWTDTGATLLSNFFYFYIYSFLRSLSTRRLISLHKPRRTPTIPAHKPGAIEELLLGFIAGVASRAISTPLNVITLRLQTGRRNDDDSDDESEPTSREVMSVMKDIYSEQGLAGFWRGFQTTTLLSLNPSLTLTLFQLFRRLLNFTHTRAFQANNRTSVVKGALKAPQVDPTPREAFLGAAVSNSFAVTLLYPFILAKTRLQATSATSLREVIVDAYSGKNTAVHRNLIGESLVTGIPGVKGLYQGLEMQIVKGFLSQGVTFLVKGRIEEIIVAAYLRRQYTRK
ncbi:mitochondrial carrier domain-containing protein [Collybia nuda]|uniref:Mitochondrial carrier domain-containing protein n=1 Tax=Collybia nuda TaxID=64659 RepID=A0A9P5Y6K0_9AGAR|nr:mitochondrial carrier domain-containing protein [Collybia nuda]